MGKKRRRANGEGSIYRRGNGKWIAALTVKRLDNSTKTITRTAKSAEHARLLLHQLQEEYRDPTRTPLQMTVGELVDRWFERSVKKWDQSTADNHQRHITKRIKPILETWQLSEVSAITVEDWVDWMVQQQVGGRTQQQAFGTLSAAFSYAVGRKLLPFNPCAVVDTPTYDIEEPQPFDESQVKQILKATREGPYAALFQLAFTTGMRKSEIFGLQRQDYNPREGTLFVRRQAVEYKGIVTQKPPKKNSQRLLTLTPRTREMLDALPIALKTDAWLFTAPKGGVIRSGNFRKRVWDPLLKKLEIRHRGFHHVRHTVATTMLTANVPPITVSGVLGHANVSTTLDIYGHFIPETSSVAADAMSSIGVKFG